MSENPCIPLNKEKCMKALNLRSEWQGPEPPVDFEKLDEFVEYCSKNNIWPIECVLEFSFKIKTILGLLYGGKIENAYIKLFARIGGGNREFYDWLFRTLRSHPQYLRDKDDKDESTYAVIYFRIPPGIDISELV